MQRRKLGYGRGARMKFEQDELTISGGIRFGLTMGSPVALRIGNTEWPRWVDVMSPESRSIPRRSRRVAAPRSPGPDPVTPTWSACRSTASTSPATCWSARAPARPRPASPSAPSRAPSWASSASGWSATRSSIEHGARARGLGPCRRRTTWPRSTPIRCAASTPQTSAAMVAEIDRAHDDGDTLGGVVEVLAYGVPPGLGSYVHWDRRLDARSPPPLMGIQAIKGVEVGDGFLTTTRRGSEAHDELVTDDGLIERLSDKAGGTEGGMTHRHAPARPRRHEADLHGAARPPHGRCRDRRGRRGPPPAIGRLRRSRPRASSPRRWWRSCSPNAVLEKFGGDSVAETRRNLDGYLAAIPTALRTGSGGAVGILGMSPTPALVLIGPMGVGQEPGRQAGRASCSRPGSSTPTRRSSPEHGPIADHLRRARRAAFPRARARGGRRGARERRRGLPRRAAPCSIPQTQRSPGALPGRRS